MDSPGGIETKWGHEKVCENGFSEISAGAFYSSIFR